MTRSCFASLVLFTVLVFGLGCGDTPEVQVTMSSSKTDEAHLSILRVNADLLKEKPKNPMDKPIGLMMLNQGDQITILEKDHDWVRVQHILSGQIGWLHQSLIQTQTRSKYWSGDTDRARHIAASIFKEKIFLEKDWPIIHINIEERWNKLVFTLKDDVDFPRDQAVKCAEFTIEKLVKFFPSWKDHQIFLEGSWEGQAYTLVMSDNKEYSFF